MNNPVNLNRNPNPRPPCSRCQRARLLLRRLGLPVPLLANPPQEPHLPPPPTALPQDETPGA